MTDREKVVKGLKCIRDWSQFAVNKGWLVAGASEKMVKYAEDALELLKAQEPVKPVPSDRYVRTEPVTFDYKCVVCNAGLVRHWVCCPCCGQAVKWND